MWKWFILARQAEMDKFITDNRITSKNKLRLVLFIRSVKKTRHPHLDQLKNRILPEMNKTLKDRKGPVPSLSGDYVGAYCEIYGTCFLDTPTDKAFPCLINV